MQFERGTYVGKTTRGTFVIRLDIDEQGTRPPIVSGDLFRGGEPLIGQFTGSFHSQSASILAGVLHADLIFRTRILDPPPTGTETQSATLDCEIEANGIKASFRILGPSPFSATFILTREYPELRSTEWTVDRGNHIPSTELEPLLAQVQTNMSRAGIRLMPGPRANFVNVDQEFRWSERVLHQYSIGRNFNPEARDWRFYMLVVGRFRANNNRVTGIMFDDDDGFQRQGCAVFWNNLKDIGDFERRFVRTATHEIGHVFNLLHSFERGKMFGLQRGSTSFMNYPHEFFRSPTVRGEAAYWSLFNSTFEPEETVFMNHGHLEEVIMGGAPFGHDGHDEVIRASPRQHSAPLELRLRLKPDSLGGIVEFGQPINVEAKLSNVSNRELEAPDVLDPAHGQTAYYIEKPNGSREVYRAPMLRCDHDRAILLHPQHSDSLNATSAIYENVGLSYGIGRFNTLEPGRYRVQAFLSYGDYALRSNVLTIWVRYPTRDLETLLAPELVTDLATWLAMWGAPGLKSTTDRIHSLTKRLAEVAAGNAMDLGITSDHPLMHEFQRCELMMEAQGYLRNVERYDRDTMQCVPSKIDNAKLEQKIRTFLGMTKEYKPFKQKADRQRKKPQVSNLMFSQLAKQMLACHMRQERNDDANKVKTMKENVIRALEVFHRDENEKTPLASQAHRDIIKTDALL